MSQVRHATTANSRVTPCHKADTLKQQTAGLHRVTIMREISVAASPVEQHYRASHE